MHKYQNEKNTSYHLILKFTVLFCLLKLPKVPADCNEELAGESDDAIQILPVLVMKSIICKNICILSSPSLYLGTAKPNTLSP